ncbi:6-pyruvoyl-tetrahydropterin synthase-related protein [Thermococcus sp.]
MRLKSGGVNSLLIYTLLLLGLSLFILKDFLSPGYPPSWGGDAYGHLFKIWKLMEGYSPWIEDWYGGYPFLRFYPPLSYLIGAFFGLMTGSAIWGYKLTVLMAFLLAGLSTRAFLREIGFSELLSSTGGVAYAFSPYHLRILSPEGNFPRFFAISLAPLLLLGLFYVSRGDRKKALLAGVLFALVGLGHHTLFLSFGLLALFLLPSIWPGRDGMKDALINLSLSGLVGFLVSAFWLVPFLTDRGSAHFLKENSIEYLFKLQSARPAQIVFHTGPWSYYQGFLLYFAFLGGVTVLRRRERRALGVGIIGASSLLLLLALGYYGPLPGLNRLPVLDMIPPYRWLDGLSLMGAIGLALFGEMLFQRLPELPRKKIASLLVVALLLLPLSDVRYGMNWLKSEEYPGDYVDVLAYVKNEGSTGWRYFQWGLWSTQGSRIAYTPALTDRPILGGWYRQGDPSYPQHSRLNSAILNDPEFTARALRMYAVKYVLLDKAYKGTPKAEKTLKSVGFREVHSSGRFLLYGWDGWNLLTPSPRVLVIGDWPVDLGVPYERGRFVDDYAKKLSSYSLVILNGYSYRDVGVWFDLQEYVRNGGVLVVNTFRSPDAEAERMGVRSFIVKVYGEVNLSSTVFNTSKFSKFQYEGQPWTATAYTGNLMPIITLGNLTVLGYKDYGKGRVYFVGLNLPYHSVYANNDYEKYLLRKLLAPYLRVPELNYTVLEFGDGRIRLRYSIERPSGVIVSENYFPHWEARVDGKKVPVEENGEFGLIELNLPAGEHELELVFHDPFTPLRYLSLLSLLLVLGYLLLHRWA